MLFVDLRDNYGITQIVFDGGNDALERVRPESVIMVTGTVVARDASQVNDKIPTGTIEIAATKWEVLIVTRIWDLKTPGLNHSLRLLKQMIEIRFLSRLIN